jgi:hypothetical protein
MHATLPDFTGASQQLSDPKLPAEPGFYIRFGFHYRSPFSPDLEICTRTALG